MEGVHQYPTSQLLWEKTRPCIRWLHAQEILGENEGDGKWNPRPIIFPDEPEDLDEWERHTNAHGMGPYYTRKKDNSPRQHCRPTSHRPAFCTIKIRSLSLEAPTANFRLGSQLHVTAGPTVGFKRVPWDLERPVSTLKVVSTRGRHVGFVTIDGETLKRLNPRKKYTFVGISRTVEEGGERDAAWDPKSRGYAWKPGGVAVNPDFKPRCKQGWSHVYDHNRYPCNLCWGLYNVLMVDDNSERLGVGQIHSQAFEAERKGRRLMSLN